MTVKERLLAALEDIQVFGIESRDDGSKMPLGANEIAAHLEPVVHRLIEESAGAHVENYVRVMETMYVCKRCSARALSILVSADEIPNHDEFHRKQEEAHAAQ